MIILGIDPGVASVGYGVVKYEGNKFFPVEFGTFHTPAKTELSSRLKQIYEFMTEMIAKHKIDMMSVEKLYFNTNITTGIPVAHARGVILLAGANAGIELAEFTPLQVKQAVTGYGKAEKKQVQEMTRIILGLQTVPKPDDTADALALAICCAHSCGSNLKWR